MVKKQIRSGDYLKGHILLIFILIMVLLVSSCAPIPWSKKYKLSEHHAAAEISTNVIGEVKIFYAVCRSVEEGIGDYVGARRIIKPIYGITEPYFVAL